MKSARRPRDAIGLHGDFWTKFLLRLLQVLPSWICVWMTWPLTLVFYLLAAPQRAGVLGNLRALNPCLGPIALRLAGYRVFRQFALTYMDRLWSIYLGCPLRWDFEGHSHLVPLLERPGAALLFATHSGNYDIAAALFAQHSVRPIHMVRMPEQTQALQHFRATELRQAERRNPQLRVHYASDEWTLGLDLCRLLNAGEIVAVQGDRVLSAAPSTSIEYEGVTFCLPRGPLILAEIARVPCYPVFLTRVGRCHYRLRSGPPFHDGKPGRSSEEIGRAWLGAMKPFVVRHWDQWFVFERILTRTASPPSPPVAPDLETPNP